MSTITKERAQQIFLGNGPEPTASEELELARIALASLEAEAVGEVVLGEYDDCGRHPDAKVVCIAADGQADWENFKDGTRLYSAPPAPVSVPTFYEWLEIRGNKPLGWVKDAMRESYDACRAAMLQGADGNSPVIPGAYDIETFGIFSATESESGLMFDIERFRFGVENCPKTGKENMVPKFALQAIINRLQAHCDSMGEDALIDIFTSSAEQNQETK